MKLFVSLCFLAVIASALADCGCLKCNPNLQIVSPKYSPCKVIYRGANSNCASASPYLLQAALPPPPPVFVPKEYDYQIQLIPIAQRPDYTSVYEYGLQAAVVPPPVYTPLKNLRSATERVVLDSPACGSVCGGYGNSNCNTGYVQQAPLPAKSCSVPVPICYQSQQECDCRGPIIEPLCPSLAPRYDNCDFSILNQENIGRRNTCNNNKKCRSRRDLSDIAKNYRPKRDILDLPMNFMFKFIPNLFRGPILHAIHTIQHNANPAVIRSRVNVDKQRVKAHMTKTKLKHKFKNHNVKNINSVSKLTKDKIPRHQNVHPKVNKTIPKGNKDIQRGASVSSFTPIESRSSLKHGTVQGLISKDRDGLLHEANDFLRDFLNALHVSKESQLRDGHGNTFHTVGKSQQIPSYDMDELQHFLAKNEKSPEVIRDLLLEKLQKFNEIHKRGKRSIHSLTRNYFTNSDNRVNNSNFKPFSRDILLTKVKRFNDTQKRKKRSILLGSREFSLPFFEIDDEILDDANNYMMVSEEQVGTQRKSKPRRKNRNKNEDSEMESGEEILGASHPLHQHPFVVLLRTPLKLLHHLHDMRKNFLPILYSFPKLLHSSKTYLKDFGKNLQTGVLDFASNVIGEFDAMPKRQDSIFLPARYKRSPEEDNLNPKELTEKNHRSKRYILKVVDEDEVQEFLKEKLGGYFDTSDESKDKENDEDKSSEHGHGNNKEVVAKAKMKTESGDRRFLVRKLSPKVILDNNGRPFIEINGNKRPLFFGKHKGTEPVVAKAHHSKLESSTASHSKNREHEGTDYDINDKIDEVITKAREKLKESESIESKNCDEIPTQTIKEKILQISTDIQNLINLDYCKYLDLYEDIVKLDHLKVATSKYWKNVMINEKTDEISCKLRILNYFKDMQNEKDKATKKIAELLKTSDNFVVKKLIKLLVRLQKLQCIIQKVVDHFDNRMKIGTRSDTEKEIKFVDYLSSLQFISCENKEELECFLKKEKNEALEKEIKLLENLRKLLQKDDMYTTNEVAKQIWEMKNIEKLQQEAIEEMNCKLENNMKIRKELKILFDLLKQIETAENTCEELLGDKNIKHIVGSNILRSTKQIKEYPNVFDLIQKMRNRRKKPLLKRHLA